MKTTGKIISLKIDGEEIGRMTGYEATVVPYPVSVTGTVYYKEAEDYFMKALMYALTYKN